MNNKIFLKIGAVLVSIILIYVLFTTFIISPKISSYLIDLETKQAKTQLDRISSIIDSKEIYLKEFQKERIKEHKENIRNISYIAYTVMNNYYEMYLNGKLSKEDVLKYSFETISKIEYGHEDDYIYVLDKHGTLVFHPDKNYHNKNIFYTADANGKLFVEDIIKKSRSQGETYTRYSWGKLNKDFISEKIVHSIYFKPLDLIISSGVYIENIKQELEKEKDNIIKELDPLIKSIVLGDKGYIFIVNGQNIVLIHENENLVKEDISFLKEPNSNNLIVDNLKESFKKKTRWSYKWNKPNDLENYSYDKIAWVNYNKFFDWYIVSSIYKDDLELKSKEINGMIINISLLILISLAILAIVFIRKLLSPISLLSKNADLVKEGNFEVRNNIDTNDELGVLGKHFDKMLDSIEKNTKNLESKVELRTAEIEHRLYHDELTQLKNRESLVKDLQDNDFCALSCIDIDGFDEINELYGFEVGNEILLEVTYILSDFANKNQVSLYRINSDLFAILDTNMKSFMAYDKFLEKIQELFNYDVSIKSLGIDINISITIGSSISQEDPINSANMALKKAKQNSLKFTVYNQTIDTKDNIKNTMFWRDKIKYAIENDTVMPFYQAIYNKDKEIVKYEVLMRILDEVDGKEHYITPGYFLDIAVKTKQDLNLSEIVIRKALNSLEKLDKNISINISFSDILSREFNLFIEREILQLPKELRKRVVFEILESDSISDYDILDNFIFKFREKGVKIAIDDFGTGYSNFSHILKVKPDYLKIDGSLIKNIDKDENSYKMVKSIVDFSKSLDIKLIAEYIHSKEVYKIVKELGVDEFQGFYLGEPKPLIELIY